MNTISKIQKSQDLYQVILDNGFILNISDLMVLDFDGAQNVAYRNEALNIAVENITIAASLEAETQAAVLEQLNATASGILYLSTDEAAALNLPDGTYSTIYIGDTDDLDALGGAFSGIAETTGTTAAADKADNAFVLTNRIGSVEELASVIAHEAGHLTGALTHDYGKDGTTIDDFMTDRQTIAAGQYVIFIGPEDYFSGLTASSGGAIINNGTVTLNNVLFSSNRAIANNAVGGAIFNSTNGTLNVFSGTIFESNFASNYGGAILNSGFLTLDNATFTRNSTTNTGGAIQNVHGCTATVMNALFTGNSAKNQGGTILAGGTTTITGNTFTGNIAKQGGAVTVRADTGIGIFSNNTFSGNYASEHGGAIYNLNSVKINGGSFDKNSAGIGGGAVYNTGTATISGTFSGNNATSEGGAVYNTGSATLSGGIFTSNAASHGGAIHNTGTLSASSCTFTGNSANDGNGGAILAASAATITDCTFSGNNAKGGGAIFAAAGGSAVITDCTFSGNSASSGGAIIKSGTGTFSAASCTFSGNSASSGGAVYIANNKGNGNISSTTFSGNSATNGGAIYNNSGSANLSGGIFTSNNATSSGGAIFNMGSTIISGGIYSANSASIQGGAIWNNGTMILDKYAESCILFQGNKTGSGTGGGAIWNNANGKLTLKEATFTENESLRGACIYNQRAASATFSAGVFSNNTAKTNSDGGAGLGGAFYNSGTLTVAKNGNTGASFEDNTGREGGAIYNAKGTLNLSGASFRKNSAASQGGAILNSGATVNLQGGNIFQTDTDTIYNLGKTDTKGIINFTNSNTLGGDFVNLDGDGTAIVNFNPSAVTTLTNSAKLINNAADTQTLEGTLVVEHTATKDATSLTTDLADTLLEGNWTLAGARFQEKTGFTANDIALESSFTNANGAKLWFGSNNGKTGITDNTLVLNTTIADADYSKFNTYSSLFATYADFDGIINVTGGSYDANLYGNKADLLFDTSAVTATGKLVVGGHENGFSVNASTITVNAALSAGSIIGGDQYKTGAVLSGDVEFTNSRTVSVNSASTLSQFIVAGNLLNSNNTGSYIFSDRGRKTMTISNGNAQAKILVGGSIAGSTSKLEDRGDSVITISGGTYTFVDGAGYLQSSSAIINKTGTTTLNINGGSFTYIYGGVGASQSAYLAGKANVSGEVRINVDAASAISVNSIYGGCSGKAVGFTADTTITFSGLGSNLTFISGGGVAGGNATKEKASAGLGGVNTLAFNGFSGDFNAPVVRDFDTINFIKSTLTFTEALALSLVKNWNFDGSSTLTWNNGSNSFKGDTLDFTGLNDLTGSRIVINSDGDDLFAGLSEANVVKLNGGTATWDAGISAWTTTDYKLSVDTVNHDLVITKLA